MQSPQRPSGRRIGRWGTTSRVVVGAAMLVGAAVIGIRSLDAVLGLLVVPLAMSAAIALRGRNAPPVRLTGAAVHCLNCGVAVAAFVVLPVAALLFYGTSMLLAAARGDAGCEVLALSNWVWRRDDQLACPLFHPVDVVETRATRRRVLR